MIAIAQPIDSSSAHSGPGSGPLMRARSWLALSLVPRGRGER